MRLSELFWIFSASGFRAVTCLWSCDRPSCHSKAAAPASFCLRLPQRLLGAGISALPGVCGSLRLLGLFTGQETPTRRCFRRPSRAVAPTAWTAASSSPPLGELWGPQGSRNKAALAFCRLPQPKWGDPCVFPSFPRARWFLAAQVPSALLSPGSPDFFPFRPPVGLRNWNSSTAEERGWGGRGKVKKCTFPRFGAGPGLLKIRVVQGFRGR